MIVVFANIGASLMLLAGVGLMIYMLMRKAHLQQVSQQRTTVVNDMKQMPAAPKPWQTSREGVDMADLARDLNGQLTTKMIVLEQLIADSQKQIEHMEDLLNKIEQAKRESRVS